MSIPLILEATKDAINTSIIAIKRNIERINMLLGLVDSGSPDLSGLATKQELEDAITQVETDLAPVDEVTSGNMHSVTSNAVAEKLIDYQSKEWKILEGYNISGIEYDEVAVSVWFEYANTEVVYSEQFSKGMLGGTQVLVIGGYYISANDYGLCNLNFTNGLFGLRNVYYAGQNFKSASGMRIRYR